MIKQYNGFKAERRQTREQLPPGGYVIKILATEIEHYRSGDKLVLSFDIAEGDFKDFYRKDYAANQNEDKKWRGKYSVWIPKDDGSQNDEWSKRTFNDMTAVFEDSDPGFHWDWDETKLKGRIVGGLFREEEWSWENKSGWATRCFTLITPAEVRDGNFKTPERKPLKTSAAAAAPAAFSDANADDGDLPF